MKSSLLLCVIFLGCASLSEVEEPEQEVQRDYRSDMRSFVIRISKYAKKATPNFAVIPQNGLELVTDTGDASGNPETSYLNAIDANGQEGLFYGYQKDDKATPNQTTADLTSLLNISKNAGNAIFVIDYCSTARKVEDSFEKNRSLGYIPFIATERNLTLIPTTPLSYNKLSSTNITVLDEAKNFLFFLNYENYTTKEQLLAEIIATDYDVVIIDLFFNNGISFTSDEITRLKVKANGGERKVICYMSIGEAEDYRFYWNDEWASSQPQWLEKENKNWPGNYKVKYWEESWQQLILGNSNAYLDKVIDANFDGVYLDIIDGFQYFENL